MRKFVLFNHGNKFFLPNEILQRLSKSEEFYSLHREDKELVSIISKENEQESNPYYGWYKIIVTPNNMINWEIINNGFEELFYRKVKN